MFVCRSTIGSLSLAFLLAGSLTACGSDSDDEDAIVVVEEDLNTVPEFFLPALEAEYGVTAPALTRVASKSDGVLAPNDLEFHPHEARKNELWVLNQGTSNRGGSTVTISNAGLDNQSADYRQDGNAWHFMSMPTAMAFSDNGNWGSTIGVQDANHGDGTFAGPTMWSSDMDIYAVIGETPTADVNGSHLDMLHGSPFSMGMAHDVGNAFWVFDGYHGHLVRYDFQDPHYPGGHYHDDGLVHRHTEVELKRHETLPSHMVLDKATGWLYINETVKKRILRVDTATGTKLRDRALINEQLEEHWDMHQTTWEVFATTGLDEPVGIAIKENRLFVGDHASGDIIAFDTETKEELARVNVGTGIRGLTIGPDGLLWFANYDKNEIVRVDPR